MANETGNPQIAEYGRLTRFGVGNCPRVAQRRALPPWSIKKAVRRLMAVKIHIAALPVTPELLLNIVSGKRGYVTMAELLACQMTLKALEGDLRAIEWLIYLTDGPPPSADMVEAEEGEDYDY